MGPNSNIDLTTDQRRLVVELIKRHLPYTDVWAYGSRVTWTSRPQSDLDLVAFSGPEQTGQVSDLREAFEESDLPFQVDMLVWDDLPESFQEEIDVNHCPVVEVRTSDSTAEMRFGDYATLIRDHVDPSQQYDTPIQWREFAVEDIAEVVGGGTPSTRDSTNFGGRVPWLTPRDLSHPHDRYVSHGTRNLTTKGLASCSARLLPAGSVLLSTRAPVGYVAIAKKPIAINQGFQGLIPTEKVRSEYMYYWLTANIPKLEAYATGSTFPELTAGTLKKIKIAVPPLPEQDAIVHVLGMLDDKIELNRRMNVTLESILQTIYKAWFVDFVPMRHDAEAKSVNFITQDVTGLFPKEFVDTDIGSIPKGWTVERLGDCYSIVMGQSPPSRTYSTNSDAGLPFFQGSADFGLRFPKNRVYCSLPKRIAQPGSTLISVRAPVGHANIAYEKCCIGRGLAAVLHHSGCVSFTFHTIKETKHRLTEYNAMGTVFGAINKKQLANIRVVQPPIEVIQMFERLTFSLYSALVASVAESTLLANVRDDLVDYLLADSNSLTTKLGGRSWPSTS